MVCGVMFPATITTTAVLITVPAQELTRNNDFLRTKAAFFRQQTLFGIAYLEELRVSKPRLSVHWVRSCVATALSILYVALTRSSVG